MNFERGHQYSRGFIMDTKVKHVHEKSRPFIVVTKFECDNEKSPRALSGRAAQESEIVLMRKKGVFRLDGNPDTVTVQERAIRVDWGKPRLDGSATHGFGETLRLIVVLFASLILSSSVLSVRAGEVPTTQQFINYAENEINNFKSMPWSTTLP
jgi:hypothetical protein